MSEPHRIRINFDEGDHAYVAAATEMTMITEDVMHARRCHSKYNAEHQARIWQNTMNVLGLSATVVVEPYDQGYRR